MASNTEAVSETAIQWQEELEPAVRALISDALEQTVRGSQNNLPPFQIHTTLYGSSASGWMREDSDIDIAVTVEELHSEFATNWVLAQRFTEHFLSQPAEVWAEFSARSR